MSPIRVWPYHCFVSVVALSAALVIGASGCSSVSRRPASDSDQGSRLGQDCLARVKALPAGAKATDEGFRSAFIGCLADYIRIDTSNPPGPVDQSIEFWREVFSGLGIPNQIVPTPGKQNFIASMTPANSRLTVGQASEFDWSKAPSLEPGSSSSIVLLNHMDVVPVFPDQWARPDLAFSGAIEGYPGGPEDEKFIWGRGALDMKSTAVLQMLSMAQIKRDHLQIRKTIHFLADADEEVGMSGSSTTLQEIHPGGSLAALADAEILLNEGGGGSTLSGKPVFLIGTEEKGGAWLKLRHRDPLALIRSLDRLQLLDPYGAELPDEDMIVGQLRRRGCGWSSFETPGAKINVAPSKAFIRIRCEKRPSDKILKRVKGFFEQSIGEGRKSIARVDFSDNDIRIDIELPSSGHGSVGNSTALTVAARGLQSLRIFPYQKHAEKSPPFYRHYKTPAVADLIGKIASVYHLPRSAEKWLSVFPFLEDRGLGVIEKLAGFDGVFRTRCTWTGYEYRGEGDAEALLDCRLLHTGYAAENPPNHGRYFMNELAQYLGDPELRMDLDSGWNYTRSPNDGPALKIFAEEIQREHPDAIVSSLLFPAGSDITYFRDSRSIGLNLRPIASYGFLPVRLGDLTHTIHGSDERFPVSEIEGALKIYTNVVRRLSE